MSNSPTRYLDGSIPLRVERRVGLDLTAFVPGRAYGAQTYVDGLLTGIRECADLDLTLVCGAAALPYLRERWSPGARWKYVPIHLLGRGPFRALESWLRAPRRFIDANVEVVFFPFNLAPRTTIPSCLMVHDLVSSYYRRSLPHVQPFYHELRRRMVSRSMANASELICSTSAVAEEITVLPRCRQKPVHIIPLAVERRSPKRVDLMWNNVGVRRILVTSFRAPHKNPECVVEALGILYSSGAVLDVELWFTGPRDSFFDSLEKRAYELGVGNKVFCTGYLAFEQVLDLYSRADIVVFESEYEGFGLPAIEAQTMGAALVLSDLPVLREVSRGGAEFFRSGDATELASKLKMLFEAPTALLQLRARSKLASATLASQTWRAYALSVAKICSSLTNKHAS